MENSECFSLEEKQGHIRAPESFVEKRITVGYLKIPGLIMNSLELLISLIIFQSGEHTPRERECVCTFYKHTAYKIYIQSIKCCQTYRSNTKYKSKAPWQEPSSPFPNEVRREMQKSWRTQVALMAWSLSPLIPVMNCTSLLREHIKSSCRNAVDARGRTARSYFTLAWQRALTIGQ